jgi:RNA polymerase sigma-70 factor (ECF subfamily)
MAMHEEGQLIAQLKNRDDAAFVDMVRRHHGYLLALARFYVPDRSVAEEVVQDAWLAVLTGIDRFEERSSFKTWISRIVMNVARTRGVRESRMVAFSEFADREAGGAEPAVDPDRFMGANAAYPDHWSVAPKPWSADPERQLLAGETQAILDAAIETLPEAQRLVLTLRDVQGWSAEEVCNALGLSETNQRVLLHRARSKVRGILERHDTTGKAKRGDTELQGTHRTDYRLSGTAVA